MLLSRSCGGACASTSARRSRACARTVTFATPDAGISPSSQPLAARVLSAGAAAVVALSLLGSHAPAQAAQTQFSTLADVMREQFAFVDSNKDGFVDMTELKQISSQVSEEEGFAQPPEEQLAFTLRLFDLNQDGRLTTDEMLTSLALDAVVTEDEVDADAMKVFDQDGDGVVQRADWSPPFGDMGRQGEVIKDYIFDRVDHLYDGNGKLEVQELINAISLVRTVALGY